MTDLQQRDAEVVPVERVRWLAGIVSDSLYREKLRHSWTTQIDGEPWTVATDGMRMVLLRGDFGAMP